MDEVALEERERLGLGVVELDTVSHLGADLGDVGAHLGVEIRVVDEHPSVVTVELFSEHPDGQVELAVEQTGLGGGRRFLGDGLPACGELGDVSSQLVAGRALSSGADDQAVALGADLVKDLAQTLSLLVAQSLRDADR